jgi:VanZ family protein
LPTTRVGPVRRPGGPGGNHRSVRWARERDVAQPATVSKPVPRPGGPNPRMSRDIPQVVWSRAIPALTGIVVLLWILATGRPPRSTMLLHEVYNLGHIPLFGLVALLALEASRALLPRLAVRPFSHYLVAFVSVACISLVSEVMQIGMVGRQAEVQDAVHNLIGAICFLAVRSAFDTGLWSSETRAPRGLLVGAALFALFVLRFPQERWPGITVREPYPVWSGYDTLRMEVFSLLDKPVPLTFRIEDVHSKPDYRDAFNRTVTIHPGLNPLSITLEDMMKAPAGRNLDLNQVTQLSLSTSRPDDPFSLFLSDIWLE